MAITERELLPGTRVRIRASSHVLRLRSDTGMILRPDRYDDYYVIHLDEPAVYCCADGTEKDLADIVEAADNLIICRQ